MGASSSKKYTSPPDSPVSNPSPPLKTNKKYKSPTKAITVSSTRIGAAVYDQLYAPGGDPPAVLGRGRYGDVTLARRRTAPTSPNGDEECKDDECFAVRTLDTRNSSIEDMRRQVELFERLQRDVDSKFIAKIADCCLSRDPTNPIAHVVFQRCEGEWVDVVLSSFRDAWCEERARDLVNRLLTCLAACHDIGVTHRQVRAEHVLALGATLDEPRLAGWGLAAPTRPPDASAVPDAIAAPADLIYTAPELVGRGIGNENEALQTHGGIDVWALGVLFHVLLFGKSPVLDVDDSQCENRQFVRSKLRALCVKGGGSCFNEDAAGPLATQVSKEGKTLLREMLFIDPAVRPTPAQLLKSAYLRGKAPASRTSYGVAHLAAFQKRRKNSAKRTKVVTVTPKKPADTDD